MDLISINHFWSNIDIVHRESNVGEESDLYQKVYCICCLDCCDGWYASML